MEHGFFEEQKIAMVKKPAKNFLSSRKWSCDTKGTEWEWTEPDGVVKELPEVLFWTGFLLNIFLNTRLNFSIFFVEVEHKTNKTLFHSETEVEVIDKDGKIKN